MGVCIMTVNTYAKGHIAKSTIAQLQAVQLFRPFKKSKRMPTQSVVAVLVVAATLVLGAAASLNKVVLDPSVYPSARCLDGSPAAYYFRRATSPQSSNKWLLFVNGGGWCYSDIDCLERSKGGLGSSNPWKPTMSNDGILSEDPKRNPTFASWNVVAFIYCDGGSFTGSRADPVDVRGTPLYFRGFDNLKAIISDLLVRQGMSTATDVLFSGCSAGGLSTYLHADQVAAMMPGSVVRFKAFPISGMFLHRSNMEGVPVYIDELRATFDLHNSSAGAPEACLRTRSSDRRYECLFAQNVLGTISVPVFLENSAYDSWSLMCVFASEPVEQGSAQNGNCSAVPGWGQCLQWDISSLRCSKEQIQKMTAEWGIEFRKIVAQNPAMSKPGNGGFIHSCYSHCAATNDVFGRIQINGVVMRDAVTKWWNSNNEPASEHTYQDCNWNNDMFCNRYCA